MSTLIIATHQLPPTIVRRSGNFKPNIWDIKFIDSLTTDYTQERYGGRVDKLKGDVMEMFNNDDVDHQLELIDNLQRLGLAYHFDNEIKCSLKKIYHDNMLEMKDLHATALKFRLLRQGGYYRTSQDVFKSFMEKGNFKECVSEDVNGMLSLYEASYFSYEGEDLMEVARCFTTKTLEQHLLDNKIDDLNLSIIKVRHALELPLNWRMPRLEARWYIDVYEKTNNMIPVLLELAKLDYNILQGIYQTELKTVSRWHKNVGLCEKLKFVRDRLVECYIWHVGMIFEPQFVYGRIEGAKQFQLITFLDDIYDVYGTVDELEIFTDTIERWDINSIEQLPDYMKTCFLAFYNFVNEMVYQIFKEHNINVLPYLKRGWIQLVKGYMVEARWYHSGYKPTLEEYMSNAMFSIGIPIISVNSYVCTANPITKEALEFMDKVPDIIRHAAIAGRLADDYGTTKDEIVRGDVPTSIQCYMYHNGASEEVARQEMTHLMRKAWKEMYKCRAEEEMPLSNHFLEAIGNLVRTGHYLYHIYDGFSVQDDQHSKDMIVSLLANPIPL